MGELELSRHHMECMQEGVWLNDEVINFYLGLLQDREKRVANGGQPRVHFHNTFFYNKLYRGQREYNFKAVSRRDRARRFAHFARLIYPPSFRWTAEKRLGYHIMDCELIIVPVHQEMHWVLAVIDVKLCLVSYLDSLRGVDRECQVQLARCCCMVVMTRPRRKTWPATPATRLLIKRRRLGAFQIGRRLHPRIFRGS